MSGLRIHYRHQRLVAATPTMIRWLLLGCYRREVEVDVSRGEVRETTTRCWAWRRRRRWHAKDIAAVLYGDMGGGVLVVGVRLRGGREVHFFRCREADYDPRRMALAALGFSVACVMSVLLLDRLIAFTGGYAIWLGIGIAMAAAVWLTQALLRAEYFVHDHSRSIFDPLSGTQLPWDHWREALGPQGRAPSRVFVDVLCHALRRPLEPPNLANAEASIFGL